MVDPPLDLEAWPEYLCAPVAGWSSLVARWAHNPKVVGSNPTPATKQNAVENFDGVFCFMNYLFHGVAEDCTS
jgi:hypothetical protein